MSINNIIKAALFTPGIKGRWGLPTLIEGKPGTAKTATVEELAMTSGLHCEVVIASLREPSDFLGLPIPTKTEGQAFVSYAPPRWAKIAAEKANCLVIFDELNTAPPLVQASLLRVILEGAVGDLILPKTVRFVAIQNATEDAAGGFDLAAPLANRFGHLEWPAPNPKAWADWILGYGGNGGYHGDVTNAETESAKVMSAWPTPWAAARGLITGFLGRRSQMLLKMPAASDPAASRAWPSPRTWEMATRAIASSQIHGLTELESHQFAAAFIGQPAMTELLQYEKEADLPDPEKLLDLKFDYKHDKVRLDRTLAVLNSCVALITPEGAPKRQARAKAFGAFMEKLILENKAPDLTLDSFVRIYNAKLMNALNLNQKCYDVLTPMMQRANVVMNRPK